MRHPMAESLIHPGSFFRQQTGADFNSCAF